MDGRGIDGMKGKERMNGGFRSKDSQGGEVDPSLIHPEKSQKAGYILIFDSIIMSGRD